MNYEVLITDGAERDLEAIHDHLLHSGSKGEADHVLDRLMAMAESLATFPERGSHPKELASLGILDYRQVYFKPYRTLYRVIGKQVIICLIADGRREMQTLLMTRLLANY
ncbi:MAG: type II toxin-antitoxin system RelE/ParE family toxin [Holophaga sp.]|nr:type II toxin-antitoxin system RelE/ParE family toxin [Holophaga sp.]